MSQGVDLLAHLETFVAVADEMSFSRAADELGIAQPLLSRRIKSLEKHLGGDLFDRSRRQIELTDLGDLLVPYARDVLHRSEHLLGVAMSASRAVSLALGVPPDCDPAALARIITAGAERGVTLSVRELPATQRAAAVEDGTLPTALVRVATATAPIRVRLGLTRATPRAHDRPVHLDELRPRRGSDERRLPTILLTPEDDISLFTEQLTRATARAGLPENTVRATATSAAALAEMLAGTGVLVCSERYAHRHGVGWAPLADESLHRGYRFADASNTPTDWLVPLLAAAVGADAELPRDDARPVGDDERAKLAVH